MLQGLAISDRHDPVAGVYMCEIDVFGCGAVPYVVSTGARHLRVLGLRRGALNAVLLIAVIKTVSDEKSTVSYRSALTQVKFCLNGKQSCAY